MKKFGILCAVEKELSPYLNDIINLKLTKMAMLTFYEGKINEVPVAAVYSGVGKINAAIAAQILIDKFEVDFIIVSGTAGGIAPDINVFDTVVCMNDCCRLVAFLLQCGDYLTNTPEVKNSSSTRVPLPINGLSSQKLEIITLTCLLLLNNIFSLIYFSIRPAR